MSHQPKHRLVSAITERYSVVGAPIEPEAKVLERYRSWPDDSCFFELKEAPLPSDELAKAKKGNRISRMFS